jgi:hypothetical protein
MSEFLRDFPPAHCHGRQSDEWHQYKEPKFCIAYIVQFSRLHVDLQILQRLGHLKVIVY